MAKDKVPLNYGFYVGHPDGPDLNSYASHLPFATWFTVHAGPKVGDDANTTVELYQCSDCAKAKLKWIANHPESEWAKLESKNYERVLKLRPLKP